MIVQQMNLTEKINECKIKVDVVIKQIRLARADLLILV